MTIPEQTQLNPLEGLPILIPVPLAAELLGISRSAAYRCAASGDLPTTHLGGRVYVVTARLRAAAGVGVNGSVSPTSRTATGSTASTLARIR